jgi:hypothetical protein
MGMSPSAVPCRFSVPVGEGGLMDSASQVLTEGVCGGGRCSSLWDCRGDGGPCTGGDCD